MVNLCIPFNSIERIGNKLSANNWLAYSRRGATRESIEHIGRSLKGALVEVVVELAESRINTGDLLGLRVGDIITTEKDVREPLDVFVQGMTKYRAKAGAFKGRKAIQIEQMVSTVSGPSLFAPMPPAPLAATQPAATPSAAGGKKK